MTHLPPDFTRSAEAVAPPIGPLPPLTLAAFSATPETGAVFERLQMARQMGRVRMTVQGGGIEAAISACTARAAPQILLVECDLPAEALLARLDALAEQCEPETRVLVVGSSNDIGLYRALLRQGVSDYLPRPVRHDQLLRSLSEITGQPGAVARGAVTAFVGSGGGVGSSTLALNTAWLMGHGRQAMVSLIDLDLDFGTAGLSLAFDGGHGIAEALAAGPGLDGQMLDGLFDSYDAHLRVLAAPEGRARLAVPAAERIDQLTDLARLGGQRVVLDLPVYGHAVTEGALRLADQVVLTTTPDLAGLRNTRKLLALIAALRPGEAPPFVVLNRQGMARRQEISAKDFAQSLGIGLAAVLPFDAKGFAHATNLGRVPASLPGGRAVKAALLPLVRALTSPTTPAPPAPRPLLARLLRRA